ncbi:hypothetical protein EVAR_63220_1 [Eumeta japonica]|uniref:Uncharacterized protein n=1 Tax=Eumeta variegata TaxID=151549 RepID=A0A4C1ZC84_EUMVA|nr:hypothetical protein EVAR_63220_1 [Eumeta japonica]
MVVELIEQVSSTGGIDRPSANRFLILSTTYTSKRQKQQKRWDNLSRADDSGLHAELAYYVISALHLWLPKYRRIREQDNVYSA